MKRVFQILCSVVLCAAGGGAAHAQVCGPYTRPEAMWSNVYDDVWHRFPWNFAWEEHVRREFRFDRAQDSWAGLGVTPSNRFNTAFAWARHVNALALLQGAPNNETVGGPINSGGYPSRTAFVRWGYYYVQREVSKYRANCTIKHNARTVLNTVTVYDRYFGVDVGSRRGESEGSSVTARAAILIHEARHAEGCAHNGNDRGGRCSGSSCDESWHDGCFVGVRPGANRYAAEWAISLFQDAHPDVGAVSNAFLRERLTDYINHRIDCRFDDYPGFRIGPSGAWATVPPGPCDG